MGNDFRMEAKVRQIVGTINDAFDSIVKAIFAGDRFEELRISGYRKTVHPKLTQISAFLGDKNFIFQQLTICDFLLYETLQYVMRVYKQQYERYFENHFSKFLKNFESLPQIDLYIVSQKMQKHFMPTYSKFSGPETYPDFDLEEKKKIILGYWPIRGKGQHIKYLMEYLKIDYEDVVYTDGDKWFKQDKVNMQSALPNLPYINDNGCIVTEQVAILEYITRKAGKYDQLYLAHDPKKEAQLRQINGSITDVFDSILKAVFSGDKFEQMRQSGYRRTIHQKLEQLATFLGSKNFVFGEVSISDFLLYETLQYVMRLYKQQYEKYFVSKFANFLKSFENIPEINEYFASGKSQPIFLPAYSPFQGHETFPDFPLEAPLILGYWGIRGRGEPLRILSEYLKLNYEDKAYTSPEEWFGKDKNSMSTPFANLPYVKDGMSVIAETVAVEEYLVLKAQKQNEIYGQNDVKQNARINMLKNVVQDVLEEIAKILIYEKDNFEQARQQIYRKTVHHKMTQLINYKGEHQFLDGSQICIADIYLYEMLQYFTRIYPHQYQNFFKNGIDNFLNAFRQIEQLQDYFNQNKYQVFLPPDRTFNFMEAKFEDFELEDPIEKEKRLQAEREKQLEEERIQKEKELEEQRKQEELERQKQEEEMRIKKEAEEAERIKKEKEEEVRRQKEEQERIQREKEEEERRIQKEKEEEERRQREEEERRQREEEERRIQKEKEEEELRIQKEKEEEERKQKEEEERKRIQKEKEEEERRIQKEKEEEEQRQREEEEKRIQQEKEEERLKLEQQKKEEEEKLAQEKLEAQQAEQKVDEQGQQEFQGPPSDQQQPGEQQQQGENEQQQNFQPPPPEEQN